MQPDGRRPQSGARDVPPVSSSGFSAVNSAASEALKARAAQTGWAATPLAQRLQVIKRARQGIAARARELAAAVEAPGRPMADTLIAEALPLADACRFLEREASQLLAPLRLHTRSRPLWLRGVDIEVRREPLGIILIIGPSNYPLFLPGVQVLQALAAGNGVLLKPGRGGSAAALALAHVLGIAGLPTDLFRVLPEAPEAARAAIMAGVDKVLLTGSADTGRAVLAELAPHLTPSTMELSGCDAAFVRADADLDLVARALAFSLRLNGGATCIAPRRLFVAQPLAQSLESRLGGLSQAVPARQVDARISRLVADALEQGARLIAGRLFPGMPLAPLVVTDASPSMRLLQEDVLAPVLAVVSVRDDEDAIHAAEQCPYALGATIFGGRDGAQALAARLRAGVVVINDLIVPAADPRLPFGGRGRSGYGVTRGAEGLLELTAVKAVAIRHGRWHPHFEAGDAHDTELFQAYITAVHGTKLSERASASWALLQGLVTRTMRRRRRQEGRP
jgi:acyl-CoA reductase-like NAD-dependent aldehyde dehydrogenase